MTVEQFIDWAMAQPRGRYELYGGRVVQMSPERTEHIEIKGNAYLALRMAVQKSQKKCHVLTDGATIRIDGETALSPTQSFTAEKLAPDTIIIPEPVIVVEVTSPSPPERAMPGSSWPAT